MYTSVVLSVFKDLSNLKTLENYLQVEYHYPKCLEPKVMFQILDSVFRFWNAHTLPCGWKCIYFIHFTQLIQVVLYAIYSVPEIHM